MNNLYWGYYSKMMGIRIYEFNPESSADKKFMNRTKRSKNSYCLFFAPPFEARDRTEASEIFIKKLNIKRNLDYILN